MVSFHRWRHSDDCNLSYGRGYGDTFGEPYGNGYGYGEGWEGSGYVGHHSDNYGGRDTYLASLIISIFPEALILR